jgi:hypothetical protein
MSAINENSKLGSELHPHDQQKVLREYVDRHTKEHPARWTPNKPYPVQFASDQDWLEHTRFGVRRDGRLDARCKSCHSMPTWPDNPELRRKP